MATRKARSSTGGMGRSRKVAEHRREHELFGDEIDRLMLTDPELVRLERQILLFQRRLRRLCSAEAWAVYLQLESVVNERAFLMIECTPAAPCR